MAGRAGSSKGGDKVTSMKDLQESIAKQEALADEIASTRATMVDLDRKRNMNREALTAMKKQNTNSNSQWVFSGDTFLKLPAKSVQETLQNEQKQLDADIEKLRERTKVKAAELLGMRGDHESMKGMFLKSIDKSDAEEFGISGR